MGKQKQVINHHYQVAHHHHQQEAAHHPRLDGIQILSLSSTWAQHQSTLLALDLLIWLAGGDNSFSCLPTSPSALSRVPQQLLVPTASVAFMSLSDLFVLSEIAADRGCSMVACV